MAAWTNATLPTRRVLSAELPRPAPTSTDAGILRPPDGSGLGDVYRPPAGPAVADVVERYWSVCWDTDRPARREVLSHPAIHLTVTMTHDGDRGTCSAEVHGVVTRTFAVDLQGRGRVVGAKFRPGGFTALTGRPAYAFTDRVVPLGELVTPDAVNRLTDAAARAPDDPDIAVAALTDLIAAERPARLLPAYPVVLALVADMLADRTLTRVEDVADRHGLSVRALQRLFRRFVGVGPKWVLQRYRPA